MTAPSPRLFVAYARVSTQRQGRSGLGLEAQQASIHGYVAQTPGAVLLAPVHVEIESGRKDDRPELKRAIERCQRSGAALLIAKLDRLGRDAAFILNLLKDSGIEFVIVDMPNANRLTVGIMALVAEDEARRISERTKAALAAAKARGVKLGGSRGNVLGTQATREKGAQAASEARSRASLHHAHRIMPAIAELRANGATSLHQLAAGLTAKGIPTPRGGAWTATAVRRALAKAGDDNA